MGQNESKPVQVVEVDKDGEPVYNVNAVKNMLQHGPGKSNTEVFVICMSGVYRSGKTFLLNLLKTYLDHCCKCGGTDTNWEETNYKITGARWAQGEEAVTNGIWMYMYPQLISGKGIILMDCEGNEGVMEGSPTLDNLILFLGLQLSDVHILNVDRTLGAGDLDRLGLCILHDDGRSGSLFERQLFLIRNWSNKEVPRQLDVLIELGKSKSVRDAACGISNAFKRVEIRSLPYPGRGIDGQSVQGNVHLLDASQEFRTEAKELFRILVEVYLVNPISGNSRNLTKEGFIENFLFLYQRDIGNVSSRKAAYEESLIKGVLEECRDYFLTEVESNWYMGWTDTSVLKIKVGQCYGQAVENFHHHRRVKNCENPSLTADYLKYLQGVYTETMERVEEMFEMESQDPEIEKIRKAEENRNREIKELQSQLDEQSQKVNSLKQEVRNNRSEAKLKTLKDSLKAAEQMAEQTQTMRDAVMKLQDQAHAERVERVKEQERKNQEQARENRRVRDRLKNPSIVEAGIIFGKSLVNNLVGKLFSF